MKNDLDNLLPLMRKRGVSVSKEIFHSIVNKTFHDIESQYYDYLHKNLDLSLQQQFDLLANDFIKHDQTGKQNLTLLDIGCGTGMSTEKILRSPLSKYISKIYLLDTSIGMLKECKERARKWNIPYELIEGDIFSITDIKADIILTCSVLHHIPNLDSFLKRLRELQNSHGYFIHLQDSNGDYLDSPELKKREEALLSYKNSKSPPRIKILFETLISKIRKIAGHSKRDYIDEVNDQLISQNIIKTPLKRGELWSITDIHVEGLPYSQGKGISIKAMTKSLADYKLVNQRSYAFFGDMKSELPEFFCRQEEAFINAERQDGRLIAGIWYLNI